MARSELSDWLGLLGGGSKTTNLLLEQIIKLLKQINRTTDETNERTKVIDNKLDRIALALKLSLETPVHFEFKVGPVTTKKER